jgi:hypothetical protein
LDKHTAYFNILDALPQQGCAVCRVVHDVEFRYMADVLYSKTTSVSTRHEFREARGFCTAHAKELDEIGHALDLSIIYQDILMTLRQELERPSARQATGGRGKRQLVQKLGAQRACPVCAHRDELLAVYVETLADHLADPEFVDKVRVADPFCLAHYRQIIEQKLPAAQFQALRQVQLDHWAGLIVELGEFVRKHDHRFRHESIDTEGTAWKRAIDAVTGTRKF